MALAFYSLEGRERLQILKFPELGELSKKGEGI